MKKFLTNEAKLLCTLPVKLFLDPRKHARTVIAVNVDSIIDVVQMSLVKAIVFERSCRSFSPQRLRFDSEADGEEVWATVSQGPIAEYVAVAERVEKRNCTLVVTTRTALLPFTGRTVTLLLPLSFPEFSLFFEGKGIQRQNGELTKED